MTIKARFPFYDIAARVHRKKDDVWECEFRRAQFLIHIGYAEQVKADRKAGSVESAKQAKKD